MNPQRPLPKHTVRALLTAHRRELTPFQALRIRELVDLIDEDGFIPLDQAIETTIGPVTDPKNHATFRKFRTDLSKRAADKGIDLTLEVDTTKVSDASARRCWFAGKDPTSQQLAEMSRREAQRGMKSQTVSPLAVVLDEKPTAPNVYVSVAPSHMTNAQRERVADFIRALTERSKPLSDINPVFTSSLGIPLGEDRKIYLDDLADEADFFVVLVSPALLAGDDHEAERLEARPQTPRVGVLLESLPQADINMRAVKRAEIVDAKALSRATPKDFPEIADRVLRDISLRSGSTPPGSLAPGSQADTASPDAESLVRAFANSQATRWLPKDKTLIDKPPGAEITLERGQPSTPARDAGTRVDAVDRLVQWATDASPDAPNRCALLGDLGMGKSTTTKLLTKRLLQLRAENPSNPLPILFDLRDLDVKNLPPHANHRTIMDAFLKTWDITGNGPQVDDVLSLIRSSNCVVIFDGLDEILVNLSEHQQQLLTRALWRAVEPVPEAEPVDQDAPITSTEHPTKLLLSCRTHFFRSVEHEVSHFTGEGRETPRGRDYLALIMLPFSEQQIREYLEANVPDANVDQLMDLIASVHNLSELAERPLMLDMITESLTEIERAKLAGESISSVTLYSAFVSQWLHRDSGKHSLTPEHKQVLMEQLAARLWRDQRNSWTPADLEQWMLEYLHSRPDMEVHYPAREPALWKDDLRTATFLVRNRNDEFTFAHTSLREYFLSRYLVSTLLSSDADLDGVVRAWSIPVPSPETLDFLGQNLAALTLEEQRKCVTVLDAIKAEYRPQASELAFRYALLAINQGYPHHPLSRSALDGADLRWMRVRMEQMLDLSSISLRGADLRDTHMRSVDLSNADLSQARLHRAEFHECTLDLTNFAGSQLVGTIFRFCSGQPRFAGGSTRGAQALMCEFTPCGGRSDWHVAPNKSTESQHIARLEKPFGNSAALTALAFAEEGNDRLILASGDQDGNVVLWDPEVGSSSGYRIGHHESAVSALAFATTLEGLQILVSIDEIGELRRWDPTHGIEVGAKSAPAVWPIAGRRALGFHQTGQLILASSTPDGPIAVTNVDTGKDVGSGLPTGLVTQALAMGQTHAGRLVVAAATTRTHCTLWDPMTGEGLATFPTGSPFVSSLATGRTPDSPLALAIGTQLGLVHFRNPSTGSVIAPDIDVRESVTALALAISPDGLPMVAIGGVAGTLFLMNLSTGEPLGAPVRSQRQEILAVVSGVNANNDPEITTVCASSRRGWRGSVRRWDPNTGQLLDDAGLAGRRDVQARAVVGTTKNGGVLCALQSWSGSSELMELTHRDPYGRFMVKEYPPGGELLAIGAGQGAPLVLAQTDWRGRTLELGDPQGMASVEFSPAHLPYPDESDVQVEQATFGVTTNGEMLLAFSYTSTAEFGLDQYVVHAFEVREASGNLLTSSRSEVVVSALAFGGLPGGKLTLAVGRGDGTVIQIDPVEGSPMGDPMGDPMNCSAATTALAFGASTETTVLLAAGSANGSVRTWDAVTGTLLSIGEHCHAGAVTSATFYSHSDGKQVLVTGSADGTLKHWDPVSGQQIGWEASFLPDGEVVVLDVHSQEIQGATSGAWRWLRWHVKRSDGSETTIPAESFGPLPDLSITQE